MGTSWHKGREPGDPWDSSRPRLLLAVRCVFCLYTLCIFIVGIVSIPNIYFIYLTHWGVSSVLLFYVGAMLAICWGRFAPFARCMFELAWTLEFIITTIFWTWVYPQETDPAPVVYNVSVHALMLFFVLCDYSLNRLFFRLKWLLSPVLVVVCYSIVNIPITFEFGEVYPKMTYTNGWTYLVICYTFIVLVASYALAKLLDRFKDSQRRFSESMEMLYSVPAIASAP